MIKPNTNEGGSRDAKAAPCVGELDRDPTCLTNRLFKRELSGPQSGPNLGQIALAASWPKAHISSWMASTMLASAHGKTSALVCLLSSSYRQKRPPKARSVSARLDWLYLRLHSRRARLESGQVMTRSGPTSGDEMGPNRSKAKEAATGRVVRLRVWLEFSTPKTNSRRGRRAS